jgi:hypothetical protein
MVLKCETFVELCFLPGQIAGVATLGSLKAKLLKVTIVKYTNT